MFEKFETSEEVEILTDPQTRALKGGGCTCKKTDSFSCNGYNDNDTSDDDTTITIGVPKLTLGF